MALSITPAVDKWLYQMDAFTIIFKAYDDNGNYCRNDQVSIQYSISYDGTMPDLTQMQRVYSDASGIITLVITKPCVISLYGRYARDINDPSKGESIQEIAINYKITFQSLILDITSEYTGPDISVTNSYNGTDLLIQAKMSDGTTRMIPPSDCIITDYEITKVGENIKSFVYIDPLLGTAWNLDVVINGVPKLLSLDVQYIGQRKALGDKILPEEVYVYGTFLISQDITEQSEISSEDWFFIDIPIITDINKGVFRIGYQDFEVVIKVPYDIVNSLRLNVWYEGAKIEVGKTYDPNDLVIYLIYPNGEKKRLSLNHCTIDSYLVTKEGWNWFTVTYTNEFKKVTQEFPVEGVIYKDYIDLKFKVLYGKEDLTEKFRKELSFDNVMIIDWNQFLKAVNRFNKYGLYIVTVPKLLGLSNKYDMDWEVLCIDKNTLKANIIKIYNEEENENG